jgi:hypothetical protein
MIDKALYKFFEYIDLFFEKIESIFKRKKK